MKAAGAEAGDDVLSTRAEQHGVARSSLSDATTPAAMHRWSAYRDVCFRCGRTRQEETEQPLRCVPMTPWPDPTPEILADPLFETIWQVIKRWDINVPDVYEGYCGATGNHARAIYDAVKGTTNG